MKFRQLEFELLRRVRQKLVQFRLYILAPPTENHKEKEKEVVAEKP